MGFLKRIFGGGKEDKPERGSETPRPDMPGTAAERRKPPSVEELSTKELVRLVGMGDRASRAAAAKKLAETRDRTAMRPLMNAYLNHEDPEVLEALMEYGDMLTQAAVREAQDPGVVGDRRARMMDILGVTGSEQAIIAVRGNVDPERNEPLIHTRACLALARLGDESGVDLLAHDLELTDLDQRRDALVALQQLDIPAAKQAVADHVNRYLAEAGAVPDEIRIAAPGLEDPDAGITPLVAELIRSDPPALTVVVGSGAMRMARVRQTDLRRELEGFDVRFSTRRLAPEEQIEILVDARDEAAADPNARVVVVGSLPSPGDSPPLPHFLTPGDGPGYQAKVLFVDPHEYKLVLQWWHYVDDKAEVPTTFEAVLAVSRPENSAISREEYLIWQLTPDERKNDFLRAFLAHL